MRRILFIGTIILCPFFVHAQPIEKKINVVSGNYTAISFNEAGELDNPRYFINWNPSGEEMLLRSRHYAELDIPKHLRNSWWEYTDNNLHACVPYQSVRHIIYINQAGKIIKFKNYADKANTLIPECLWINNEPCFVYYGDIRVKGRKLYLKTDVARDWLRGIKGDRVDNFVEVYNIVTASNQRLYIRPVFSSEYVLPEIYKSTFPLCKFKRIHPPYCLFPMVPIGEFPDEVIRTEYLSDLIFDGVTTAINLMSEPLSLDKLIILDSLGIGVQNSALLNREGNIDLNLLCETLSLLNDLESKNKKVLLLCSSEGHMLSKLVGECFHYLKSGELINNSYAGFNNVIEYCCNLLLLPEIESLKTVLDDLNY